MIFLSVCGFGCKHCFKTFMKKIPNIPISPACSTHHTACLCDVQWQYGWLIMFHTTLPFSAQTYSVSCKFFFCAFVNCLLLFVNYMFQFYWSLKNCLDSYFWFLNNVDYTFASEKLSVSDSATVTTFFLSNYHSFFEISYLHIYILSPVNFVIVFKLFLITMKIKSIINACMQDVPKKCGISTTAAAG